MVEIAEQPGHSPVMALDTYAHVVAELKGAPKVRPRSRSGRRALAVFGGDAAQTRPTRRKPSRG